MGDDKTGGPAYPYVQIAQPECQDGTWNQTWEPGEPGMTMLDAFAMAAMQGMLAADQARMALDDEEGPWYAHDNHGALASRSYEIAAAMLAEKRRIESEVDDG